MEELQLIREHEDNNTPHYTNSLSLKWSVKHHIISSNNNGVIVYMSSVRTGES